MWELLATTELLWQAQTGQAPLQLPTPPALISPAEPELAQQTASYLKSLSSLGFSPTTQGVWLQAGSELLVNHNGAAPLSAASVTKVATSLVVLEQFGPEHRFMTQFAAAGPIRSGVLEGDLVVVGGNDPLFVHEEGAVVGQRLNQMGIRQVRGNLVIVGPFTMNFETDPLVAGVALRESLDARTWPAYLTQAASEQQPPLPRPQVEITGTVMRQSQAQNHLTPLFAHQSLPLIEIIRQMNIYSSNDIAESLAGLVGGGGNVAQKAVTLAQLPARDIQLINGSGLGVENRVSPRAACGMLQTLQAWLEPQNLSLADVFPMAGRDQGTVQYRQLPPATLVKTGTLWNVSALVGVVPTQKFGPVCFALINNSTVDYVEGFRARQDQFVQALSQRLGRPRQLPAAFQGRAVYPKIGDVQRNLSPSQASSQLSRSPQS